ncbi:MAG: threonine/serine exporter family protein [Candidatus Cloacimonadaceae bacterium]|nr:threonine/serine exporter family protein [Candidatus Cloacimonadaceae bacterium]MDP3114541.1 threonine/serine exporter family protein [Candidatus Cloacimonadaceae bacterium]
MSPFDYNTLMQFCWAFLSILGFSIRVNLKGAKLIFIALGAGLTWVFYLVILFYSNSLLFSVFCSTILVCSYSEIVARIFKVPVSVFVTCVIIPLVPGSSLYYGMRAYVGGDISEAALQIAKALMIAGTIAMAIAVVSSVTNLIYRMRNRF